MCQQRLEVNRLRRIEHGGNEPISVVSDVEHQGLVNLVRIGKGTSNILDVAPPYGCRSLKPCHRLAGNVRRFPLEEQIQSALADHVHKHMLAFRYMSTSILHTSFFHAARSSCHSRLSRATMPANESPCPRSKARFPTQWYA